MKKFTYIKSSRLDPKLAVFYATNQEDYQEMLKAICCNSSTSYVIDKGDRVVVANYAIEAVIKTLHSFGFSEQN